MTQAPTETQLDTLRKIAAILVIEQDVEEAKSCIDLVIRSGKFSTATNASLQAIVDMTDKVTVLPREMMTELLLAFKKTNAT